MSDGGSTVAPAPTSERPGLIPPARRSGPKPRVGDLVVELGFADR